MKKIIAFAIAALLGVFGSVAQIQNTIIEIVDDDEVGTTAYRAAVERLLNLTMDEESLSDNLFTTMKISICDKMTEAKIKAMCDEMAVVLYPDLVEAAEIAYGKVFTLDDLTNLIAFYKTPTGRKFAKNQNVIYETTTQYLLQPEPQEKMVNIIMKYYAQP